ncbi:MULTISPECIES: hypothetical protein [Providencia]|uniref:hypothetical protein n=1 Tax=Providencia TaxID=586 RepID=UPI0032DBEC51
MDIKSHLLEKTCLNLKKEFINHFDWNDIDVTFFRVDVKNRKIYIISNNYEWQLICWDDNLDLLLKERLKPGIQYWNNYSESFKRTLAKADKRNLKVDFCQSKNDTFEMITVNTNRQFSLSDMASIYKYRPIISDYAYQVWKKNPDIALPMRADIPLPTNNFDSKRDEQLINHQYMRFGDIRFTAKEMLTIKMLLSHCRVKEISYIQGCSEMSEHKRIQNIKDKLGCPHASPSGLFKALRDHGVTLACLDTLIDFP